MEDIRKQITKKIVAAVRFPFRHPIEAILIALVLWIAITGIADANWSSAPKTPAGIAQTLITGEQRAFQEMIGPHLPALAKIAEGFADAVIDVGTRLTAKAIVKLNLYLNQELDESRSDHGAASR